MTKVIYVFGAFMLCAVVEAIIAYIMYFIGRTFLDKGQVDSLALGFFAVFVLNFLLVAYFLVTRSGVY